ncbi:Cse3 family CRISPR-associated protein [Methylophaga lonarensis MPL]|uniref:Cse3 family CRISPR-associated protein n=1 Tax=Methylophaga lonarensis MPL TaxID=1286106 RepID=M7PF39_9GAMM|nr:type I-E CRISPR-associated protein Cas6/Cse3/CasE [Methylophaga lonarensis]EMR12520.1 Cse3 family CRISPR-associated protein [Methylophaga lonarensis MPL]
MYLSKVKLNWAQAKNPYEQHRALWLLFPDRSEDSRDFLFRVEKYVKGQGADVIVQSQWQPQPSDAVELLATRELHLSLQAGQRLRFRLRANPIKSIKDERKGEQIKNGRLYKRSVRVPLIHEDQQKSWLARKLSDAVLLHTVTIQPELPLNFRKQKEQRSGKIQPVLFEGIFTVKSPEALLKLMNEGIGPAKSFGCGLLSLATA